MADKKKKKIGLEKGLVPWMLQKPETEILPASLLKAGRVVQGLFNKVYGSGTGKVN